MSRISDSVTMKLYLSGNKVAKLSELRMSPYYGHGFLGLFNALFHGNLEDVINDPGPPFLSREEAKKYANYLINFCEQSGVKIPKKAYKYKTSNIDLDDCPKDSLFL